MASWGGTFSVPGSISMSRSTVGGGLRVRRVDCAGGVDRRTDGGTACETRAHGWKAGLGLVTDEPEQCQDVGKRAADHATAVRSGMQVSVRITGKGTAMFSLVGRGTTRGLSRYRWESPSVI